MTHLSDLKRIITHIETLENIQDDIIRLSSIPNTTLDNKCKKAFSSLEATKNDLMKVFYQQAYNSSCDS